jgi:NAD(P)-dependent dehydrogenase (short-subunit alcohol dehydrogenase family)
VGHRNVASATLTAILDLLSRKGRIEGLTPDERLDGRVALVTGASSGLGKAVAIDLARRGAHLILACRSGIPEVGEEIRRASGSSSLEMLHVDLAELASVHALCDELARRRVRLDVSVLNAGLMPLKARRTAEGFEVMFGVHFLANRLLVERWLADGVIAAGADPMPRIVFVSSESHRSAEPIDWDRFGEFVDYGLRDGMAQYASSKLHMCTLSSELARRLVDEKGEPTVSVHSLCPGPVASGIAREAPAALKPILGPVMKLLFRSPTAAAEPVTYLACSRRIEGRTGLYLHMMREKPVSAEASCPENGARLWQLSDALLKPHRR